MNTLRREYVFSPTDGAASFPPVYYLFCLYSKASTTMGSRYFKSFLSDKQASNLTFGCAEEELLGGSSWRRYQVKEEITTVILSIIGSPGTQYWATWSLAKLENFFFWELIFFFLIFEIFKKSKIFKKF